MTVLAAHAWASNAELIADVARLYLDRTVPTLDPTYGRGVWWKQWYPDELTGHDLADDGVDFRALPYPDGSWAQVAFDPPYAAQGGRETSSLEDYNARYGRPDAPNTPEGVQGLIDDGLAECARVLAPRGRLLVKCQDYVWSGKLWPGTHYTLTRALALDLVLLDRFELVTSPRPQPPRSRKCPRCRGTGSRVTAPPKKVRACSECGGAGRVASPQVHARRNLSTLFVFEKARG